MPTYTQKFLEPRHNANSDVIGWAVGYNIQDGDVVAYSETLLEVSADDQKALADWTDQERDEFIHSNLQFIGWLDADASPSGDFLKKLNRLKLAKLLSPSE